MRPRQSRAGISSLRLLWATALLLGATALIPAAASAALEHPFLGSLGEANEPSFTEAQGLAVDQATGDLLVIDAGKREPGEGTISRFKPNGEPAPFSALATNVIDGAGGADKTPQEGLQFRFSEEEQVAIDDSGGPTDGDIYVTQVGAGVVDIFAPDGSFLGQLTASGEGPLGEPCGVAVDPVGDVYVADFSGHIHKFANPPVNGASTELAFPQACALAAGAGATDGFIFPVRFFEGTFGPVAKLDATSGTEAYKVDPGPTTTETVDPASGHLFTASGSEVKEFDASGTIGATLLSTIAPGGENVTGVAVDATSGKVYLARKGNPHIEVWGPAALLPKASTAAATLAGTTVTLHGTISADGGPPASCAFEYVETHANGFKGATTVPCTPAGPFTGAGTESVSAEIGPLPEAGYRFRLVASNANGAKAGDTLFFTTFEVLPGLPDGRAYEMVSPPRKGGEVVPPEPSGKLGSSCEDCLPGGNSPVGPMQSSPDGESVLYLGQPFFDGLAAEPNDYLATRGGGEWGTAGLSSASTTGHYMAFSADLARGVLAQDLPPLSPQAPTRGGKSFQNLYLQQGGNRQPLITTEPPNRNPREPGEFKIRFATANAGTSSEPAFEHLLFEANDALTAVVPGVAPAAPDVEAGEKNCTEPGMSCNLYEWVGGQLRLVNVLPGNTAAAASSVIGAGRLLNSRQSPDVDHAISNDGSRIFWSSEESGELYVRVDGKATLKVPGPGTCKESEAVQERACFLTATPDGSKVLLSNGQVYELNEAGSAYLPTVDLTLDEGEVHQGGFRGILGAAEDLSRVYFVDTAALTGAGVKNANGEDAEEGKPNLYAWHGGELGFIGVLLPGDGLFNAERFGAWTASPSDRTAQVSPDGRYLAFMSAAPLTGYDNSRRGGGICSEAGEACREVFEYSADTESLSCASCNPSGQRPLGGSNLSVIHPEGPPFGLLHNLSPAGDGRLFFESRDALTPRDVNGEVQDVYEWEPQGVGSCKHAGGCVYLISSGQSPNDSQFLDSSAGGRDAFFITRERLLPRDKDEQYDLYDARVGGGFAEPNTVPCPSGEACLGPASGPGAQQSPASATFTGPGNQKPHKQKKHHKKKQHKKKQRKHQRAAKHNRGGRR